MRRRFGLLVLAAALAFASGFTAGTAAAFSSRTANAATLATATLAAPGGVSAAVQSDGGTVRVNWSATTSNWATGHRVYRATAAGGPYTKIAEFANRTTLTYNDVPGSGMYYYRVAAYYTGSGANWESQQNGQAGPIKPLAYFAFNPLGIQLLNSAFPVTITAKAIDESTVTAFTGTVSLSSNVGTLTPTTSGAFTNGVRVQSISISALIALNATLTATGGTPVRTGTSPGFVLVLTLP